MCSAASCPPAQKGKRGHGHPAVCSVGTQCCRQRHRLHTETSTTHEARSNCSLFLKLLCTYTAQCSQTVVFATGGTREPTGNRATRSTSTHRMATMPQGRKITRQTDHPMNSVLGRLNFEKAQYNYRVWNALKPSMTTSLVSDEVPPGVASPHLKDVTCAIILIQDETFAMVRKQGKFSCLVPTSHSFHSLMWPCQLPT